ncbi:MAG: 50S ribosomal protein L3 [Nitrospirae bacterium RBG_19FT_COMBO_42_15]|nr:MAG: 50S ribosomal protein L3 [Nitrospirae bacterium RBG_19FT_COMBO_42_15]
MINGIIGEKLGMTQIFTEDGNVVAVTVIEAGPCAVVQIKRKDKDGYDAVQLSFREIKKVQRVNKPDMGHFKKVNLPPARYLREVSADIGDVQVGQTIYADIFKKGDKIDVTGVSIGKGFAGVMKRHNFKGGPETHGSMFHRAPGSIGSSSYPSRVWKNKKLPGHMGMEQKTIQRLEIMDVRKEENLILIRGAVPGCKGRLVMLKKAKKG